MRDFHELREEVMNHPDFIGGVLFDKKYIIEDIKARGGFTEVDFTDEEWEVIDDIINESVSKWDDFVDVLDFDEREDFWGPLMKRLTRENKIKKLI